MAYKINPFTGLPEPTQDDTYSVFEVAEGEAVRIPKGRENLVTSPQTLDGILIVDGRNTIQ